jgi:hypothetical protein
MLSRIALMSFSLLICVPVLAGPKEEALAAYQKFFDAFATDNHDQIVRLFAPDALFYGIRSAELVTTPEGVRQHFVEALTGKRGSVKATPFEQTASVRPAPA